MTIPGILVYVIALPAYLFSVVYKNQEFIELIKDKQDLSKQKQFQVEQFVGSYGFLFNGYKKEYYYFEFITMFSKVLIIFATEYLRKVSNEIQVLISIIIIISSIMSIIKLRPYESVRYGEENIQSQSIQMVIMYVGLFYMTNS